MEGVFIVDMETYNELETIITATCEACPHRESCSEDLCPFWQIEQVLEEAIKPKGTYQCFHCLSNSVVWQSDFSFEDYGLEGDGVINVCHCANCGAHIEYYIPIGNEEENSTNI